MKVAETQEQAALWRSLSSGRDPRCRQALFNLHLPLARRIVSRIRRQKFGADLEVEDLNQYAAEGLLQAIDRFDPDRGIPFEGFATRRIAGAVRDGIAQSSEVRRQMAFRARIRGERLRSLVRANPGADSEALDALGDLVVELALGFLLEEVDGQGDDHRNPYPSGYANTAWSDTLRWITRAVENLPEQQRTIIRLHYLEGLEFARIADVLSLSRGRISQVHAAALSGLRNRLPSLEHLQL